MSATTVSLDRPPAKLNTDLMTTTDTALLRTPIERPPRLSGLRLGLATVALAGAAVVGFAVASAMADDGGEAGPTVMLPGKTSTGPGETIPLAGRP